MSREFHIIQLQLEKGALKRLQNRQRHQLVGCMHAHNELAFLNRLFMFSLNDVGEGELHDHTHGMQMWTVQQLLTGKLFETWNMLAERFLAANPEDPAVARLSDDQKTSLTWLKAYFGFGESKPKETPLRIIRDKTAFHYDKLNLEQAVDELADEENRVYLAEHPANGLYYAGSALVFRAVFARIADAVADTAALSQSERVAEGVNIANNDLNYANWHLHVALYGLIAGMLEEAFGKPLDDIEQLRICRRAKADAGCVAHVHRCRT